MKRKLASIQEIIELQPIEGKDNIELATILGWKVIVQKNKFKVGDLCVYIEADSILPEKPEFEFLRSRCYSKSWKGFRIRCMKMGNIVSQGIVFPISILSGIWHIVEDKKQIIGEDVSDELEIIKYDVESLINEKSCSVQPSLKHIKNPIFRWLLKFNWIKNKFFKKYKKIPFPSHLVSKTDETRLQTIPWILQQSNGVRCYITEKIDGCVHEDMILNTDKGNFTIKEICDKKIKCKVKSYDLLTNKIEYKPIINYSVKSMSNFWREIRLENGQKIILTTEHKVWVENRKSWTKVKDLNIEDNVIFDTKGVL